MASCSKFLVAKVLSLQANGQQTTVSVEPWPSIWAYVSADA